LKIENKISAERLYSIENTELFCLIQPLCFCHFAFQVAKNLTCNNLYPAPGGQGFFFAQRMVMKTLVNHQLL
jgi:hypothetical protein